MIQITPQTSSTYQPGFTVNPAGAVSGGQPSNAYYKETLAELLASMYAYGGSSREQVLNMISPVWYSAKYGEPDATDADGFWSPQTLLAFSRFASDYKGGAPGIDQVMPYVPPGPNEFIETPEQTATRIAQQQFEKDWEYRNADSAAQRSFDAGENAADRAVSMAGINQQAKAAAMSAFNNAFANEISKYGIEAGLFSDQERNKQTAFGTQANIYNTQEGVKANALNQAGSLSAIVQQLMDERTNKAIENQLNPGDWLAREAQVRAINPPEGTEGPAYKEDETLKKIIDMLINYKPGEAPQAPAMTNIQQPTAPNAGAFQMPQQLLDLISQMGAGAVSVPTAGGAPSGITAAEAIAKYKAGLSQSTGATSGTASAAATPAASTDGQWSGVRNEDVAYLTPGQRALVTTGLLGPSKGADYSQYKVYDPNRNNTQYGADESIAPGSSVWLERYARGVKRTENPQFIAGDAQVGDEANPEVVTIHNPGPDTKVSVDPIYLGEDVMNAVKGIASQATKKKGKLKGRMPEHREGRWQKGEMPGRWLQGEMPEDREGRWQQGKLDPDRKRKILPGFAYGANMFDPENLKLKSYKDEDYQNLPSLQFLQGKMGRSQYDTLSTGNAQGIFGQQLPESGRINYGDYLRLAKDPVSLAMVASSYKAGSRDLFAEVARAKARAPFGQAVQTSLIRS